MGGAEGEKNGVAYLCFPAAIMVTPVKDAHTKLTRKLNHLWIEIYYPIRVSAKCYLIMPLSYENDGHLVLIMLKRKSQKLRPR